MGEDSEYNGDYMAGDMPWVSGSSHILDTQVLRSDKGMRNTLRWLQGYVD